MRKQYSDIHSKQEFGKCSAEHSTRGASRRRPFSNVHLFQTPDIEESPQSESNYTRKIRLQLLVIFHHSPLYWE